VIARAFADNVARNDFQQRCEVVRAFVGNRDGGESVSIDAYVASHRIERLDFIKIDVDGPDLDVLKGARKSIERFRPAVVIELTTNEQQIYDFLRDLGYTCSDGMGHTVEPPAWPANLYAAVGRELVVPPKASR
jgi:hypothetical protein